MQEVSFCFEGKNFLVTGASSGIGRQIAMDIAEAGGTVLAVARRQGKLEELRLAYPAQIFPGNVDVRDYGGMENILREFVSSRGKLHGAVHAAGISASTPLRGYDEEEARAVMDTSFWAGVRLMRLVNMNRYSEAGCSSVLFSSVSAQTCEKSLFAYSAAKAGVQVAARTFAKEICRNGNRINTISPGWVNSEMTQSEAETVSGEVLGRHLLGLGKPRDVSQAALFLLSSAASWITGVDFVVDGGYCTGGV